MGSKASVIDPRINVTVGGRPLVLYYRNPDQAWLEERLDDYLVKLRAEGLDVSNAWAALGTITSRWPMATILLLLEAGLRHDTDQLDALDDLPLAELRHPDVQEAIMRAIGYAQGMEIDEIRERVAEATGKSPAEVETVDSPPPAESTE